jgi:hypothetical protein
MQNLTMLLVAANQPSGGAARYDWSTVALALLIVLTLMVGYFIVQAINRWLVKRLARLPERQGTLRPAAPWTTTPMLDRQALPPSGSPGHSLH